MENSTLAVAECHIFERKGTQILINVERTRPYTVTQTEIDILNVAPNHTADQVISIVSQAYPRQEVEKAISKLQRWQVLVPADREKPTPPTEGNVTAAVVSLELNMAQTCNLGCHYCIVGQGEFGGPASLMSWEVARASVDFLIRESKQAHDMTIYFFGGEPLLNMRMIRKLLPYATEQAEAVGKRMHFYCITNGILLKPDTVALFKQYDVMVQISIDGRKEQHDAYRPDRMGRGSFDKIMKNLPLAKKELKVFTNSVLTHGNANAKDVLDFVHQDLGIEQASVHGVVGYDKFSLTDEDYEQMLEGYQQIAEEALENGEIDNKEFARVISQFVFGKQRVAPCGAARGLLGVGSDGEIYPCKDMAELSEYKLGNVLTQEFDHKKRLNILEMADVDNKPVCKDCWARYMCGGSCMSANHKLAGSVAEQYTPECHSIRTKIEIASWLHVKMGQEKPEAFVQMLRKGYDFSAASDSKS